MKKLETRTEKDKKSKRNSLIIGVVLIIIMVFGTAGLALTWGSRGEENEDSDIVEFKGITFFKRGGSWAFQINEQVFLTRYNPQEVENITVPGFQTLSNYQNKPLYIVADAIEPKTEIGTNLNSFVLRVREACLSEDCEKDFPVKNCDTDNIIVIQEPLENETEKFFQEENCVFIIAGYENQTKMVDAFIYHIFGII
jgi:hypothetical protein